MVERFNRVLADMLHQFVDETGSNWSQYLQVAMMAYRSAVHTATGMTPNEMMLGREITLPADLEFGLTDWKLAEQEQEPEHYVANLRAALQRAHRLAWQHLSVAVISGKKYYDRGCKARSYQEGDKVMMWEPALKRGRSRKFRSFYDGPYVITKKLADRVYELQIGKRRPRVVHIDRLCYYKPRPEYLVPTYLGNSAPKASK